MKTRTFTLNGFYYFDLSDLMRSSYNVHTDTTTVTIDVEALGYFIKTLKEVYVTTVTIDVEALGYFIKTLKEVYNEIKKNDLEAL